MFSVIMVSVYLPSNALSQYLLFYLDFSYFGHGVRERLYTWTSPDGQYRNQIDYILCIQRWKSFIQSAKTRPGVNYGSDYELIIAKLKLKLKKVEKTIRPFRYDVIKSPPHSSVLAWRIPWMEEPGGLQSMGSLRVGHD